MPGVESQLQQRARDRLNVLRNPNRYSVALRYWGDDTSDDDLLCGPVTLRRTKTGAP
jgi:hypothetical protein